MNSFKRTTKDLLRHQLERINACYAKNLELIREATSTGDEVNVIEHLRPMMNLVLELEKKIGIENKNVKTIVRSSKTLSLLVENQELLLNGLLQEVQKLEMKLSSKRTQISQVRDDQNRMQEMKTAYQQHRVST